MRSWGHNGRLLTGLLGLALLGANAVASAQSLNEPIEVLLEDPAALLRTAAESVDRKEFAKARRLYVQLVERHPIVGDYANLYRARLRLAEGSAREARRIAARTQLEFPRSVLRPELFELIGEALRIEGDEAGAREAWTAALTETTEDDPRAILLQRIARSESRSGRLRAAGITWRLIWYAHPATPVAEEASQQLDRIEETLEETLRRASDWRRRGDRFFRLRKSEEALEAYQRALSLGLSKSEIWRTQRQRARSLFRLRRYPEAVSAFAEMKERGDLPIWLARSMARADRVPESIAALERLAEQPGPNQTRAHYLAGLLLSGREKHQRAQLHFEVVATNPSQSEDVLDAHWFLAWQAYRDGHYARAVKQFKSLAARTGNPLERLRPRYWQARALVADDRTSAAEEIFLGLAQEFPFSYYGWRAAERLPSAVSVLSKVHFAKGRAGLRPRELARLRILIDAEMFEAAAEEGALLMPQVAGLADRRALAGLLTGAGAFHLAQQLIVNAYSVSLAGGPVEGFEDLWHYAWPAAFSPLVESATDKQDRIGPELVYAIMREESGFRPLILSPVGARGLLQIMDETGKQLAARIGWKDFQVEALFDPATNIALGSHYLGELSGRFPTRMAAVIASYNAGPAVVSDWLTEKAYSGNADEWVEAIPYSETRGYVRRVLRSLQAYQRLY
ncbi:MAG: transglycosylase SLT domain-containing protein [Myxococcota bacterium]